MRHLGAEQSQYAAVEVPHRKSELLLFPDPTRRTPAVDPDNHHLFVAEPIITAITRNTIKMIGPKIIPDQGMGHQFCGMVVSVSCGRYRHGDLRSRAASLLGFSKIAP